LSIRAQWIFSEAGLHNLNCAGITTGWLKAWLGSAGAEDVSIFPLESSGWQREDAQWRIFFADEMELVHSAQTLGLPLDGDHPEQSESFDTSPLLLDNPQRICWSYRKGKDSILFISPGDIAYQRTLYLKHINGGRALLPLAVLASDSGELMLEPGLSAALLHEGEALPESALNGEGILIEEQVVDLLRQKQLRLRTAESCTAGGIAARIGRVPGASDVLDRSWVTYSNEAKSEELGVDAALIERFGAVSAEVVAAMAEGGSDDGVVCIAVSGIAGPFGGSDYKPVGTVWIAVALSGHKGVSQLLTLSGSRSEVQWRTINAALILLLAQVEKIPHLTRLQPAMLSLLSGLP